MNFLYKLFSDKNGDPSSKRLNGFVGLLLVVAFAIKGLSNSPVNMEMFYILVTFTGCQNALTLMEKKK